MVRLPQARSSAEKPTVPGSPALPPVSRLVGQSQSVVRSDQTTCEEHEKKFEQNSDEGRAQHLMTCMGHGTEFFRTIDMEGPADLTVLSEIPLSAYDEHGPRDRMTCNEYETESDQSPNGEGADDFTDLTETGGHLKHLSSVFCSSRFRRAMPRVKQSQHFVGRGWVGCSTGAPSSSDSISCHTLDHSSPRGHKQIIPRWSTVVPCQGVEVPTIRTELVKNHASAEENHCCRSPKSTPSDPCQATTLSLPACSQEPGMKDVSAMVGVGNQLAASGVAKSSLACQRIFEKNQASNTSHNQDVCTPTPSGSDVPSTATV